MDVINGGVGESVSIFGVLMDTALFFQAAVHALDILTGNKGHLLVAELGFDVAVDTISIIGHIHTKPGRDILTDGSADPFGHLDLHLQ